MGERSHRRKDARGCGSHEKDRIESFDVIDGDERGKSKERLWLVVDRGYRVYRENNTGDE